MAAPPTMPPLSRRDFIKAASLSGMSIALVSPARLRSILERERLRSAPVIGDPMLMRATSCINFAAPALARGDIQLRGERGIAHQRARAAGFPRDTQRFGPLQGQRARYRQVDPVPMRDEPVR